MGEFILTMRPSENRYIYMSFMIGSRGSSVPFQRSGHLDQGSCHEIYQSRNYQAHHPRFPHGGPLSSCVAENRTDYRYVKALSVREVPRLNFGAQDNDWMNTKALATKAGAVLGDLLSKRVFGRRPVTLAGFSFGSLVIFEALKYLASLPPKETTHLIQDVFLFGTPTTTDEALWTSIRRLVSGRLVNGYSTEDYVLAVLSRASDVSWSVAGLQVVEVKGVENVLCDDVDGHTKWRGLIGKSLKRCGAPGILDSQVDLQIKEVAEAIENETKLSPEEVEELHGSKEDS